MEVKRLSSLGKHWERTKLIREDTAAYFRVFKIHTFDKSAYKTHCVISARIFQTFLFADPLWIRKITADPHILAHVYIECPGGTCPELNIYISELILDSYDYIPVAYIIHCLI
jgi:hypothetical protein